MKRNILVKALALVMLVSMLCACVSCGSSVSTKELGMSLEEAQAKAKDAGATLVVADVYDESKEDGTLLTTGNFDSDCTKDAILTVFRVNNAIKDEIEACILAPAVIPQKSYEDNIYSKISNDSTLKRKFDSYYMLIEKGNASDAQKAAYPALENSSVYVLDTNVEDRERNTISKAITENTTYSAENMFNDYLELGLVPTISSEMTAKLLTKDELKTEENDEGLTIVSYSGSQQNIVVPGEIDGKPVTLIAKNAFPQSTLHAITIKDGIRTLQSYAFAGCYTLYDIILSDTVQSVEENAFANTLLTKSNDGLVQIGACDDLLIKYEGDAIELTVPEGVRFIGGGFARGNKILQKVSLPEGLLSIGVEAFRENEVMTECNLPSTLTKICDGAFRTTRHITDITIPDSVVELGEYSFFETNDVLQITIGKNVQKIGYEAFRYNLLVTSIDIPDSVTYIGGDAFLKCLVLQTVTGAQNVTYCGGSAFDEDPFYADLCKDGSEFGYLTDKNTILLKYQGSSPEVTVPDTVLCIASAFKDVISVKKVVVNDGCTALGEGAFGGCTQLADIVIPASVVDIHPKALNGIEQKVTIHCPAGSYAESFCKENHIKYDSNM